jgi:hypothetical protein
MAMRIFKRRKVVTIRRSCSVLLLLCLSLNSHAQGIDKRPAKKPIALPGVDEPFAAIFPTSDAGPMGGVL